MKIATFQMSAACPHDARLSRIISAMQEAATHDARVLITPELALSGYGRGGILKTLAQTIDGPWTHALQNAVRETGISLITGFPESAGDACHISALIIDENAPNTPKVYRKGRLYGAYEKKIFTSPGPSTVIVDLGGIKFGVLICYDVEFPENARRLARAGAQVLAVPTAVAVGPTNAFVSTHVVPVRAYENQVFVAYANHCQADEGSRFQGLSTIAAPDGTVLAAATETDEVILYADITERFGTFRKEVTYLADAEIFT